MNTITILAGGAVTIATLVTIPLGLAPVFSRRNNRRDAREHAAVTEFTQRVAAGLVAQIRDGAAVTAITLDTDSPTDLIWLAQAARQHTTAVEDELRRIGNITAASHASRALGMLNALADNRHTIGNYAACATPLANATAARLLLARLSHLHAHAALDCGLIDDAIANLAAATDALPNGRVLNLTRLSEHDPAPWHHAQAAWRQAAYKVGILDDYRVPVFNGDVMRPATGLVYPPGHRLAHTNGMDCDAALEGAR